MGQKRKIIEAQENDILNLKNQLQCVQIESSLGYLENRGRYFSSRAETSEILKVGGYVGLGVGLGLAGIRARNAWLMITWRSHLERLKAEAFEKAKFWKRIDSNKFKFWK